MPRRAAAGVRPVDPDPVHSSRLVQQVINKVMIDGKKSSAERIVYDALQILSRRTSDDPGPRPSGSSTTPCRSSRAARATTPSTRSRSPCES